MDQLAAFQLQQYKALAQAALDAPDESEAEEEAHNAFFDAMTENGIDWESGALDADPAQFPNAVPFTTWCLKATPPEIIGLAVERLEAMAQRA